MVTETRWVITGANGYVGGELCQGIYSRGGTVLALAREGRDLTHLEKMGISCHTYEDLPSILRSGEVFVHCAGKVGNSGPWDEFVTVNRDWTRCLFSQASEQAISCFVYVSSVAALGYQNRSGNEKLDESSASVLVDGERYGRSKLLAEQTLQDCARNTSTRLVILRPGLIYGRRPLGNSQTWLRRGFVVDQNQRIPMVHIDSFIEAVIKTTEHPNAQGVFLVVDKEQPTIRRLNTLKLKYGILQFAPLHIGKLGFWVLSFLWAIARVLQGRIAEVSKEYVLAEYYFRTRRLLYNTQKLRSQVGWAPAISLEDALKERQKLSASEHTGD